MLITRKIYTLEEIKQIAAPVFKEYGVTKAVLFGSYARGEAVDRSDLDICVTDKGLEGGLWYYGVREELQEVFLKRVDLAIWEDLREDSAALKENIKKDGVLIYAEELRDSQAYFEVL